MLIKKWLICFWLHYKYRCYPQNPKDWHCMRCWPCGMAPILLMIDFYRKEAENKIKEQLDFNNIDYEIKQNKVIPIFKRSKTR